MSNGVLVIAEQIDGAFRKVAFEAVSEGKRLAGQLGGELTAAVLGEGVDTIAGELALYGADKILTAQDPALKEFAVDAYTKVVADIVAKVDPSVVLLGATMTGKDLAARLAARLDAPLAMDCIEIRLDGDTLTATRPVYGGKVLAEVTLTGTPRIAAIRPNAFGLKESAGPGQSEAFAADPGDPTIRFVEKQMETGKIDLTEADAIVSGGRGMGGSDYTILEELADALNGAVGASRSAVDEGWRPHSDQVGQTGKTVSPSLYIACGISGAIQHLAGMSSSKVVVAINKDPEAPIFAKSDFGIVGDIFEVVPAITQEVKQLKG